MDYEKEYKQALEAARQGKTIEENFPVLKENEDEKIRKEIIECVKNYGPSAANPQLFKKMLAWLEKQVEQNHTNEVKSKFKIGDIISDGISEVEIVSIDENKYYVTNGEIENDANICNWVIYFRDQKNWKLVNKPYSEENTKHPQLKQREQKSSWGEEDETRLTNIIIMLKEGAIHHFAKDDITKGVEWLKYLKDRVQLQPNQEWSEEDENKLLHALFSTYATDTANCLLKK